MYYFTRAIRSGETSIALGKTYTRVRAPIRYWVIVGIYAGFGLFLLFGFLKDRM